MSSVLIPPTSTEPGTATCPRCGWPYRSGELTCARCGVIFNTTGKTQRIEVEEVHAEQPQKPALGDIYDENERTITCHIDGQELLLNVGQSVVLGRHTGIAGDPAPNVDLTPYGGNEKGVSRRHVRIQFKNHLLYVYDLGSSNGTWLNGRLLASNSGRPLRDGDELRLGRMKIQISF